MVVFAVRRSLAFALILEVLAVLDSVDNDLWFLVYLVGAARHPGHPRECPGDDVVLAEVLS